MISKGDCDATVVSMTHAGGYRVGHEELPKLISAAVATLDSDRAAAKACLQRAIELLDATGEERPVQLQPEVAAASRLGKKESLLRTLRTTWLPRSRSVTSLVSHN